MTTSNTSTDSPEWLDQAGHVATGLLFGIASAGWFLFTKDPWLCGLPLSAAGGVGFIREQAQHGWKFWEWHDGAKRDLSFHILAGLAVSIGCLTYWWFS